MPTVTHTCPTHKQPMVLRKSPAGAEFLGCSTYGRTGCRYTLSASGKSAAASKVPVVAPTPIQGPSVPVPCGLAADVQALLVAQATATLARCANCGRKLSDPISIETGMGPDCREVCGYDVLIAGVAASLRPLAKAAIRALSLAMVQAKADVVINCLSLIHSLGLTNLAVGAEKRISHIIMERVEGGTILTVYHKKADTLKNAFSRIPHHSYNEKDKLHVYPCTSETKAAIRSILPTIAAGLTGYSTTLGFFKIPSPALAGDARQWKATVTLTPEAMRLAADKLLKSKNANVAEVGERLSAVIDGTNNATPDWRHTEATSEDNYAI